MKNKTYEGFQGMSFGMMEGLIMILGMMIGFGLSYPDRRVILLAVLTAAIADSVANSTAFHVSEETKEGFKRSEVTRSTLLCFAATLAATVVPAIPLFFLPVTEAVLLGGAIAIIIMALLSGVVARISRRKPLPVVIEYVFYGIFAAIFCYAGGHLLATLL